MSFVVFYPTSNLCASREINDSTTYVLFFFFIDMKSLSPPCRISTTLYAHCLSRGTHPLARRYPAQHHQVNTHHPRCAHLSFNLITAHITLLVPSFKSTHHIPPAFTKPPTSSSKRIRPIQWEREWERHDADLWLFLLPTARQQIPAPPPPLAPVQPRFGRRLRV